MPVLLVLAAAILWGMIGVVSKFAFREGVSGLETAFWRGVSASLFLLIHAGLRGKLRIGLRDFGILAAFGVFGVALLEGSNLLAVEKGGAAFAAILLYSAPVWVAVFSLALHHSRWPPGQQLLEGGRLGGAKVLALAIALIGIVGVALSGSHEGVRFTPDALFWGMLSGISYASFYVFGKIYLSRYEPITLLAWSFTVANFALFPFVDFRPKNGTAWGAMLFLGFFSTYLAYYIYYLGLRKIEPTRASVIASIEPVVATFLAWWLWGEQLAPAGYFWATWVIGGILMMVRAK